MLTWIARLLLRTLDNIATPCSVNAYGSVRRPPRPARFDIPVWNVEDPSSPALSSNLRMLLVVVTFSFLG